MACEAAAEGGASRGRAEGRGRGPRGWRCGLWLLPPVSRRGQSRAFRIPRGDRLPSAWPGAGQGVGAAAEGEALCLLGPQEGDAAGTQGHQLYCRVSTKASNSRTFFSCAASFSGSESKSSAMDWAPMSRERLLS